MKVVVIGGSGLIGSKLVSRLRMLGHEAVSASPKSGVNSFTGQGLSAVMKGASVVIDVSNAPSWEASAVMQFFQTATRNLLEAEAAAGVAHHVALSVVGAERMPGSTYMPAKVAQEAAIQAGPTPYTIVRATQFFEFVGAVAESGMVSGTIRLPPIQFQPISADDVASMVARIAVSNALNSTVEIAGPERASMERFVRMLFEAKKDPRPVIVTPNALYFEAEVSDESLVPGGEAKLGKLYFRDWLALGSGTGLPADVLPN
jgi:uncharacterized protein YbjT (DUF2867 family)